MRIIKWSTVFVIALVTLVTSSLSRSENDDTVILSKDNLIILNEPMMEEAVGKVISQAKTLDDAMTSEIGSSLKSKKPIYIFLNTPGGSIQAGLEMYEALRGIGRPVHTITLFAASMGFQTVQNLGDRLILKNGVLMSHRAAGAFEGSFGGKFPSQIDNRYNFWLKRITALDQITVDRTKGKQTLETYRTQYADELWLTGVDAVKDGYADKVVTIKCDSSLSGTTTHSANFMGILNIYYDTSNCPINTSISNIKASLQTNKGIKSYDQFVVEGGEFGSSCLVAAYKEKDKLCAANPTLSSEKIEDLKNKFKEDHDKTLRIPIRMTF